MTAFALEQFIDAAEAAEGQVTITANAELPVAEKTSIAEAGKTQTAPKSGKQSNTQFRVKTQGSARSR